MDFFHHLGLGIQQRWRRVDLDARAFPDIAGTALADRPPSSHVNPLDVVRWVHEAPLLPRQPNLAIDFGQPPVTVFDSEDFYIQVLFWLDGTTAIHQHAFSGAFHVMAGSSLQSTYRFAPEGRYSDHLLLGNLSLQQVELLAKGDVRPILSGTGLVHSLFHLDRPSVSVVVRTHADPFAGPQYSYTRAGLAFDPYADSPSLKRKLQTLELLLQLCHPELDDIARASIESADAYLAFRLLKHLMKRLDPPARFFALLEGLNLGRNAELLSAVRAMADEERRDKYIIERRRLAKGAEHRFLLALLLNLSRRDDILGMVRKAHPESDPAEKVLGWLSELARLDDVHAWVRETAGAQKAAGSQGILDVPLDGNALEAARALLRGAPPGSSDTVEALRHSSLLRPLFAP